MKNDGALIGIAVGGIEPVEVIFDIDPPVAIRFFTDPVSSKGRAMAFEIIAESRVILALIGAPCLAPTAVTHKEAVEKYAFGRIDEVGALFSGMDAVIDKNGETCIKIFAFNKV